MNKPDAHYNTVYIPYCISNFHDTPIAVNKFQTASPLLVT
jgi:hypothetical protein